MSRADTTSHSSGGIEPLDGNEIEIPIRHEWSCIGAAFPASLDAVRSVLPTRISPVRIGPQSCVVGLVSVTYEQMGSHGPYRAAGVMIPTSSKDGWLSKSISPLSLFGVGPELEVFAYRFPTSDEESYSLGNEICGLHTGVADIEIEDRGRTHHTTVQINGEDALTLDVGCARNYQWWRSLNGFIHTHRDDQLLKNKLKTHGSYGIVPFANRATFELGDHPWADDLRALDIDKRPLGRVYAGEIIGRLTPHSH